MKTLLSIILLMSMTYSLSFSQHRDERDIDDFTAVSFGVAGSLVIEQGNTFSVVLEGDKDYIEDIETIKKDERLIIRHERWINWKNMKVTVYITMPEISDLSVSGSGDVVNKGSINADYFDISVSGSGDVDLKNLKAETIDCSISGSGTIKLLGAARDCDLRISGSGEYRGYDFQLGMLDVTISGSGSCEAMVEESIEARVSGSGDVYYKGSPNIDARVSGSGKVRKR